MTPNEIVGLAKKRVKTNTSNIDWNALYAIVIDEIFTDRTWQFARQEINYIHPQQTFEKTFDTDSTEKSLNKIISAYYARAYTLDGGGVPIPVTGTAYPLTYEPYARFNDCYPDHAQDGYPEIWTKLRDNDGTRGMQIGLYMRPVGDVPVWIWGDFVPTYAIDSNPMPILPKQFHRLVVDGLIHYAAEENEQDKLSTVARKRFELGMNQLRRWDGNNPSYKTRLRPQVVTALPRGPRWPANFPR